MCERVVCVCFVCVCECVVCVCECVVCVCFVCVNVTMYVHKYVSTVQSPFSCTKLAHPRGTGDYLMLL